MFHTTLPDSDLTVLMRLQDDEYPLWPGYHDGEAWYNAAATRVESQVVGWIHLETAATHLDAAPALSVSTPQIGVSSVPSVANPNS